MLGGIVTCNYFTHVELHKLIFFVKSISQKFREIDFTKTQ